jgi:hypothetical protein
MDVHDDDQRQDPPDYDPGAHPPILESDQLPDYYHSQTASRRTASANDPDSTTGGQRQQQQRERIRGRTEHVYSLTSSHGADWATLRVHSGAKKPTQLPAFFEGDSINGSLCLRLDKDDHITAVNVMVCDSGQNLTVFKNEFILIRLKAS